MGGQLGFADDSDTFSCCKLWDYKASLLQCHVRAKINGQIRDSPPNKDEYGLLASIIYTLTTKILEICLYSI